MRLTNVVLAAAAGTAVNAQRPQNESICDYYTTALLKNNTADNQDTLLTLLVNTVVIGNCMFISLTYSLTHSYTQLTPLRDRHHAQRRRESPRHPSPGPNRRQ